MLYNIKNLYNREMLVMAKKRIFAITFSIVIIVLTLFLLIYVNRIFVKARAEGTLEYNDIVFIYNRIWDAVYFVCTLFSIFLCSMSINIDKKRGIIDHFRAYRIKNFEIVFSKFLSYYVFVIMLSLSCMPICMVSTLYGGISYFDMLYNYILLLFYVAFLCSMMIFLSSVIYNESISLLVSIVFGISSYLGIFFYKNYIISNFNLYITINSILCILTIFALFFSSKTKIFNT